MAIKRRNAPADIEKLYNFVVQKATGNFRFSTVKQSSARENGCVYTFLYVKKIGIE